MTNARTHRPTSVRNPLSRRRGSVMIMVVALLVLLAIMGTAYLATSRADRATAAQSVSNQQTEHNVNAVINVLQQTLLDDLHGKAVSPPLFNQVPAQIPPYNDAASGNILYPNPLRNTEKPIWTAFNFTDIRAVGPHEIVGEQVGTVAGGEFYFMPGMTGFERYDSPGSFRIPAIVGPSAQNASSQKLYEAESASSNPYVTVTPDPWLADRLPELFEVNKPRPRYVWRWISSPMSGMPGVAQGEWEFDNPFGTSFSVTRRNLFPDVLILGDGSYMPAFRWLLEPANPNSAIFPLMADDPIPAADTDGDGVADAFLSKLPGSTSNGLTTYVAWRVVDNAAAVNAAVAWEHNINPAVAGNFFPTNIGLTHRLTTDDTSKQTSFISFGSNSEMEALQQFRLGYPQNKGAVNLKPIGDDGTTVRADFDFRNAYDAMWHQLGRRLEYPGFNLSGVPYQRLPVGDTLALAAGFVVRTPISMYSTTETLMGPSLGALDNQPFPYGNPQPRYEEITTQWGDRYFDETPTYTSYSRRPLMVTSNPVSQAAPVHYSRPWRDKWGRDHWVPFHPLVRSSTLSSNSALFPDMLDYDAYSRFMGDWNAGTEYFPGDLVRDYDDKGNPFTFLCVGTLDANPATGVQGTTYKPASNTASAAQVWEYQPLSRMPMKASLNTATFRELYRAFWNVMCDEQDPDRHPLASPPFTASDTKEKNHSWKKATGDNLWNNSAASHPSNMFKSSIRHNATTPTLRFTGKNQALLRAALAAVNTLDLRDQDDIVTSRTITLEMEGPTNTFTPVKVQVYGYEKQPFITKVYVNGWDSAGNSDGFALIQLFNPHDEPIDIAGWRILIVKRPNGWGGANKNYLETHTTYKDIQIPLNTPAIAARSHKFLSNYDASGTGASSKYGKSLATVPPKDFNTATFPAQSDTRWVEMPDLGVLSEEGDYEFVIVRPRGGPVSSAALYNTYNEGGTNYLDWVPVDQHDLTGIEPADKIDPTDPDPNSPKEYKAYYYERRHDAGANRWSCVYPGQYKNTLASKRHEGADESVKTTNTEPTLDAGGQGQTLTLGGSQNSSDATADLFPPIQLGATGFAGANTPTSATSGNMFPFGGFARVGDVLQVPFIGAYTVRLLDATDVQFTEMNSVSMDSAYATDKMSNNNAREHIGRFVPVPPDRDIGTVNATAPTEFFSYYDWCKDIFDHFTVFAPYDDHFPNINPAPRQGGTSSTRYPDWTKKATSPYPITMNPLVPDQTVEQQVEGLVNINTAPWRVLATVPWCSPVSGTNWGGNWEDHNLNIAKSIVIHRQLKGPFKSIMDLQDVEIIGQPGTGTAKGLRFFQYVDHMMKGVDPDDTLGDMSPPHPKNATGNPATPDAIRNDFEEYTLMLNRVSNLITTRSDSFTAYICLQQWENAGTPDARMVSQRRYAVLLDRSGIIKDKKDVKVSYVPID